jgi:hypothetical protein
MSTNRLIIKNSGVPAKIPLDSDLLVGELALNHADGYIYYKNVSSIVKPLSSPVSIILEESAADAFTLTLANHTNDSYIRVIRSNNVTVTVANDSNQSFATGTVITLIQGGNGIITLSPESGVTLNSFEGLSSSGQYSVIQLIKVSSNIWDVIGGVV